MYGFIAAATAYAAPLFMILSPILSYTDQALSMRKMKSSAGFSLDIPLIMLVASICRSVVTASSSALVIARLLILIAYRVFYYPGARFDTALLVQSFTNIITQLILLKIALDYRPAPSSKGGDAAMPFAGSQDGLWGMQRPYNFWRWRSPRPYVSSHVVAVPIGT
jgi:solute carrier family 66, member 2